MDICKTINLDISSRAKNALGTAGVVFGLGAFVGAALVSSQVAAVALVIFGLICLVTAIATFIKRCISHKNMNTPIQGNEKVLSQETYNKRMSDIKTKMIEVVQSSMIEQVNHEYKNVPNIKMVYSLDQIIEVN